MKEEKIIPRIKILLLAVAAVSIAVITGCSKDKKESPPGSNEEIGFSRIIVKMTDAPAVFDSVNVEILQVAVHFCDEVDTTGQDTLGGEISGQAAGDLKDGDTECDSTGIWGWMDLETLAGMYNLLELQNNVTAVLVYGDMIPAGHITQMRLMLGQTNYVVVDSVAHDLKTPSAQQSGLKIRLDATFEEGHTYEIVLDFDAEKSVVRTGNGKYLLKPVIKILSINDIT